MNYLAAATSTSKKPAGNKGGGLASSSSPAAAAAPPPKNTADATKMKANSPANRPAPANTTTGSGSNGDGKNTAGSGPTQPPPPPLSYAAKAAAAKKPLAASGQSTASGGGQNGTAVPATAAAIRKQSPTQSSVPAETLPLSSLVNTKIRIKLVDGKEIEGTLFTYDVYSGVVALVSPGSGPDALELQAVTGGGSSTGGVRQQQAQVNLVKAANIVDAQVIGNRSGAEQQGEEADGFKIPEIQKVPTSTIEARKRKGLMQAQERASRIGVGVSDKGQAIFDALSKTLPCRWHQGKIVVLDEVSIEPPYDVDNCLELTEGSFSLQRVKKVLQGELGRLERSGTGSPSSVATK
ncbi:hypothetical protein GGI11_000793 [Coemansia sp. RSA 2049]|nr:hypothetical protein H4217_008131 [Coemansia sp. RSA 1939]KAJ2524467.1 hypothetical protein GGI11_000793 [Coemansia sp. RSA 2049]KAJ2683410.1 hypothetical protein GGH99_004373 [Coemansia sp. RSA 1285]